MKFYDREKELTILQTNWEQTSERGRMTVLIGRRRIGKTTLLTKSARDDRQPQLYLYVSKDNERVLTGKFQDTAQQTLGLQIFGRIETFAQFFEQLMRYGQQQHFTLVFDEFQNFLKVNPAIPSHIQDIWDRYHEQSKVNMIACGSIYNMMHKIFDNEDEPLYGRQDCRMNMLPFRISILKQILHDHNPRYCPEDLLCLYALTGGVAKYVAWLMDAKATTKSKMLRWVTQAGSPYLSEGTELIMSEFGKDYTNYLSILQLIASGMTTQNEIDGAIGKNTGAYLDNLERDYSYINRKQPMFSKPSGRNSRWQLDDCFLRFWFRFIMRNQALVEMERNDLLLEIVEKGYEQYTGLVLEQYFRQKWMEEKRITQIGNYWDRKGQNEIDLIALNDIDKTAIVAEIKRQHRKFNPAELAEKTATLNRELSKYTVTQTGLSMEDM
ncbi:MAG: ATP-binding protein [Bacteroidaceae bacterium]|nr:ATP-binding protein [Bacteroidaceae bacterium]